MSVLATGATGFVGLNVTEALLGQGRDVVLFSHAPLPDAASAALSALPGTMRLVTGDVRRRDDLDRAFEVSGARHVVHAAAMTPGGGREQADFRPTVEVNLLGTLTALEAAAAHGVERFVLISSGAVYGSQIGAALDEAKSAPAPENAYGISKLAAEQLGLRFGRVHGLDVRACRLSSVFGPWERDTGVRETLSPILQVTRLALAGTEAHLPRAGRRDWTYARDVAAAIVALLDARAPAFDLYNVGSGAEWTVTDWCARLADTFPGFAYRMVDDPEAANVNYWVDRERAALAIDRLTADLGFAPRYGLDEAFSDYLSWIEAVPDGLGR